MSGLETYLDVGGIEHEVHAEHTTDSADRPVTHVELRDPAGSVVVEALVEGHIGPVRVLATARDLADAVPGAPRRWTRVAIRGGGHLPVQVTREEVGPTADGLTEAGYDLPDRPEPEHMTLHVTAYCTAPERRAIEVTLRRYWRDGNGTPGPVIGLDGARSMVCHHDPLLPVAHDGNCALLQRDALCGAIWVEVQALLAEAEG